MRILSQARCSRLDTYKIRLRFSGGIVPPPDGDAAGIVCCDRSFLACCRPNLRFLLKILNHQLVVPDFVTFRSPATRSTPMRVTATLRWSLVRWSRRTAEISITMGLESFHACTLHAVRVLQHTVHEHLKTQQPDTAVRLGLAEQRCGGTCGASTAPVV